jgi:tRNA(Ile)-lysidine synthase TilS/MesJ
MGKRSIPLQDRLAYYLLKGMNKAIREYDMIADEDRIAVAVSGGKDSLTLLHLLRLRQKHAPQKPEIIAVHAMTTARGEASCAHPDARDALGQYFAELGQAHVFEAMDALSQPDCARCAYLRRKALFTAARRLGCSRIALGHHADDAAQTTLLNLIFHGRVETLSPRRDFFGGQFVLIRPMLYLEEKEIARFARSGVFPLLSAPCRREVTSRRTLMKNIIRSLEQQYPAVQINLLRAGLRHTPQAQRSRLGASS